MTIIINFSFAGNLVNFREKCKEQEQDEKFNPPKYDTHFKLAKYFIKLFKSEIQLRKIQLNYFVWEDSLNDAKKYTPELADHFQTYENLIQNLTIEEHHRFFDQMQAHPNYCDKSPLELLKQKPIMYKDFGNILILYKKGGIIIDNTFSIDNTSSVDNEQKFRRNFKANYSKAKKKDFLPLHKTTGNSRDSRTFFVGTLLQHNPPFTLNSSVMYAELPGIVDNTIRFKVPANEVSILFGKKESKLIKLVLEYYLKFFLQIMKSEEFNKSSPSEHDKSRINEAIGLCITTAINTAFIHDYLTRKPLKSEKWEVDLVQKFLNTYYARWFTIDLNKTSIDLTKQSADSWRIY